MLFENNNYDFDVLSLAGFNPYVSFEYEDKLISPKEGFLKGNMFKNEYVPYKGMQCATLKPTCEREALLYAIMEIDFAINDLNLYLDLCPENGQIYEKFKKYNEECIRLKDEYSKTYGPLSLEDATGKNYNWLNNPWPWDSFGGSMYV